VIIGCKKCNKKFEIDSNLIPKNGRLLKCGSCNYEWFFKEQIVEKIKTENNQIIINKTNTKSKNISKFIEKEKLEIIPNKLEGKLEIIPNKLEEKLEIIPNKLKKNLDLNQSEENETFKKKKNISFFNILLVFIISIISLILIVDTFKKPISVIIPNLEYILYNLYETLNDIRLFFNDLYK